MTRARFFLPALVLLLVDLSLPLQAQTPSPFPIIPRPLKAEALPGKFTIDERTTVAVDGASPVLGDVAAFLAARLRQSTGFPLPVVAGGKGETILLSLLPAGSSGGPEGYDLRITPSGVRITATSPAGIFYGMQTLFQLLPVEFEYGGTVYGVRWDLPGIAVHDAPRFSWRGMHLDVGRHFSSKASVMRYIDLLSRYKLNTFHWHLTDDQGWRIEIKKYPRLTTVGSWRRESLGDAQPHGGFYTQDDVREVVAYARSRFVTIVPEIEMPGHACAALAAYPELSCSGGPFEVHTVWGVIDDVFCAGNEQTFEFLQDVLTEVMQLFPSTFIHVGGDECPKGRWKTCPKCQARIAGERLPGEDQLQSYFVRRIEKFLNARGRRLIGWDEILEGGLAPNATVMSWRGVAGGIEAARSGHDVVMSPTSHCYFDYYQGLTGEPKAIGGYIPLERVYGFDPVPAELNPEEGKHVLGVQGNVWTEYISSFRQVEYMAFPRACALSEVAWTRPELKDVADFLLRMRPQYDRLAAAGVNVRIPTPSGFDGAHLTLSDTTITIVSPVPDATVRYTTDGTEPTAASRVAEAPISVGRSLELRARTFLPTGKTSVASVGYYSRIDPAVNGVSWRTVRGFPAGWQAQMRLPALAEGIRYGLDVDGIPPPADSVTYAFAAVLHVERDGVYAFTLKADDRAFLTVDGYSVASDTTTEWWKQAEGRVFLRRGGHPLTLVYLCPPGRGGLDLQVQGPGLSLQRIPAAMLRRK
jgi:hexosaminidase